MAIEGDRVVGKETLAIALGRERTLLVLSVCSLAFTAMLLLAAWTGVIPSLGYILSASGLYALGYLAIYRRGLLEAGLMLESLVEGNMILAGLLAFFWDPYNTLSSFWFSVLD
jgi:4-hydroxy-3-methylbut-2-enyl diphosphate reductase